MAKCKGCGEELHYVPNPEKSGKWRALNADNSQHYCGGPKKEFIVTAVDPTEHKGEVTLSQREWTNLREQIVAIHMQLSEMAQMLKAVHGLLIVRQQEPETQVSHSSSSINSLEDQINAIDFDQMLNDDNPS